MRGPPGRVGASMKIAIIGTGNIGGTLGRRWLAAGHEVTYGSRDGAGEGPGGARQTAVGDAIAGADVVVLAVPGRAVGEVVAADILGTTATAVNSALIRARAGLPPDPDPHDVPLPKSPAEAAVVDRFVSAFERFDLDELMALLTDDARLTMPPELAEHRGPGPIAGFLLESHVGQDLKFLPTRANGQPALVLYLPDPSAPIWRSCGLIVLTLRGNQIHALTRFADLGFLARFGFTRTLPRS